MTYLQELAVNFQGAAASRGYKTVEVGPGVSEALLAVLPEHKPAPADFYSAGVIGALTGMSIIEVPGMQPGEWKITRHDHCVVVEGDVTHDECTELGSGILQRR